MNRATSFSGMATAPTPVKSMTRWQVASLAMVGLVFVGGVAALGVHRATPRVLVETVVIVPQTAVREIMVRGIVEAPGPIPVLAPQGGVVASIAAPVGSAVVAGVPIYVLAEQASLSAKPLAHAKKQETPDTLPTSSKNLARERAMQTVAAAEKKRAGLAVLVEKGFAVPAALDRADRDIAEAKAAVPPFANDSAISDKTAVATDDGSQTFEAAIVSPGSGQVASLSLKAGQRVSAGQIVAMITPSKPPALSALVARPYATEMRAGLGARLILDVADAAFPAEVATVGLPDPATGAVPVRVVAKAAVATEDRIAGAARIVLERREQAILIPRTALFGPSNANILVVIAGRARARSVRVSAWPGPRALVLSGLKRGDRVITNPDSIADETLVRFR